MLIIFVAFLSSISFGFSDFLGGVAARSARVISVTSLSYVTASIAYAVGFLFVPSEWTSASIGYGIASGAAAIFGFVGFYAALASGPIAVMSPAIALVQTIIPVAVGAAVYGEQLGWLGWAGVLLALTGAWLLGGAGRGTGRIPMRSVVLALMAGSLFALSMIILDASPASGGLSAGFIEMVFGFVVLSAVWWASGHNRMVARMTALLDVDPHAPASATALTRSTTALALTAGLFMGAASALVLVALHGGELAIVSAVVALYPLGTVLLARLVLKERLTAGQWIGIALALAACTALSV